MRIAPIFSAAAVAIIGLPGCAVVETAATVTSAAVDVTATAVSVTGKVVGAGVDAATSSGDSKHDDHDSDTSSASH